MFRKHLFLATAAFSISSAAFAGDTFSSAMDLAIQHFNADGSKDIVSWGPEHTFMYNALEAVKLAQPQLANVQTSPNRDGSRFVELQVETDSSGGPVGAAVTALSMGCGWEAESTYREQDLGFTNYSINGRKAVTYRLTPKAGKKACSSPLISDLNAIGIDVLKVETRSDSDRRNAETTVISIGTSRNLYRDMRYVRTQMLAIPGIDKTAMAQFDVAPEPRFVGQSDRVTIEKTSGKASMSDSFVLVYNQGEGDCLAGCIHKWTTRVKVTMKPGTEKKPTFTVNKL